MRTPKRQAAPGIRRRSRPIPVALTAIALTLAAAACAPAPAGAQGTTVPASATVQGQRVQTEALPSRPFRPRVVRLRVADRAAYARAKRRAAKLARSRRARRRITSSRVAAPAIASAPRAAVVGGLNQPGVSAEEQIATFPETGDVTPPDTTGAIGPEHYVEFVNSEIAAYARADLKRVGEAKDITEFVGDKKVGGDVCDPQIKYDPQTERWFYAAIECGKIEKENTLYVGFSKTADPTDLSTAEAHGWCGYAYPFKAEFQDYPKLGLDAQHIIIGANSFNGISELFVTAHIISAPKPVVGVITSCPEPPPIRTFGSKVKPLTTSVLEHEAFTPEPATVADSSPSGYVVAADEVAGKGKNVMIWQIGGTAEVPELKALGAPLVPNYSIPPPVPQPGSTDPIDSLDGRLTQAIAASDPNAGGAETVWTQHTIAGGAGTVVRWYELVPSELEARQVGTISDPREDVFNGAIAPTLTGGAVINYNTGSASELVKIMAQSRVPTAPLNQMFGPVELGSSSARDADFSCPSVDPLAESCRWGDYAGASVDPTNGSVVWGSTQVNGAITPENDAQWATRNFALEADDVPPTASFTVSANPSPSVPVEFNASASNDPDGTIESYNWKFGDGGEGSGQTASHTYETAGTYTVELSVEDNAKLKSSGEQTLTVNAPQSAILPPASPLLPSEPPLKPKPTPNSGFAGHASFDTKTGAITVSLTVANFGIFRWLATFPNGRFGVFAARTAKCKAGQLRLKGKCRAAKVLFGKGSKAVATAGPVTFTITPTAAGRKALKNAARRKKGVPVTLTIRFQSALGGAPVTHTALLTVKRKR